MDVLTILSDFRIAICKACKVAVLPSQIYNHYGSKKHRLDTATRRQIQSEISQRQDLIENEEDLIRELTLPSPNTAPLSSLILYSDGLACTVEECRYICRTIQGIQRHCRMQHGWINEQGRGGSLASRLQARTMERPWRESVHCQRFFSHGPRQEYFEVKEMARQEIAGGMWGEARRLAVEGLARAEAKQRQMISAGEELEVSPWLKRTGWIDHLAGHDRAELLKTVQVGEEAILGRMCQSLSRTIDRAQETAIPCVIGRAALFKINSKERGKKASAPFEARMEDDSKKRYKDVWRKLLCYIMRTYERGEERPNYRLTTGQYDALKKFNEAAEEQGEGEGEDEDDDDDDERRLQDQLDRRCLEVCVQLLDHKLGDQEYSSAIISGLAVLGLRGDGGWADVETYTPILSAVIKIARMLVLQQAYEIRQDWIRQCIQEHGPDRQRAEELAPSHYQLVHEMSDRFMTVISGDGQPTPMDWMFDTRTYGLKIRYTSSAEGVIEWIGDRICYSTIELSMGGLRQMVHGLVQTTRTRLIEELLLLPVDECGEVAAGAEALLPRINWGGLRDNPVQKEMGWNFLKDPRNEFAVDGEWWLFERVFQEGNIRGKFVDSGSEELRWLASGVDGYGRAVETFKEEVMMLMHITGGQPGRGPELLSIRHCNSAKGGQRNIFVEDGLMSFVTGYHKGYRMTGDVKIVHRYLPREVGELLMYYLWLVVPFWKKLKVVIDRVDEFTPFLWGQDTPAGEERGMTGVEKKWTSDRLRRILQRESTGRIGVRLGISSWRHIAIGIGRRYLRANFGDSADDGEEVGEEDDDAWDRQAGHSTEVAGMLYARWLMEAPLETQGRRQQFRTISQSWHRFLGFASSSRHKRKGLPWDDEMREVQLKRWKAMREVNIWRQLERLEGRGAQFRGVQEAAVDAIMRGDSLVLTIMGTGSGKSLLFMLPASCRVAGMTVVGVPLISLRGDLRRRCEEARIRCVEWDCRQPDETASIVLVTPESAVSKTFRTFLNRVRAQQRLDRIVIDECHTVLDATGDFRPKLLRLGELTTVGIQMVFLTATLSPMDEGRFFEIMSVRACDVRVFRGVTTRKNVKYSVQTYRNWNKADEEVQQLVQQKLEEYGAGCKIIIYCGEIERGKELAGRLSCPIYYAKVDSREGKQRLLENFINGKEAVMVATNALGLGINVPDIRLVIHVERPRRLRDYAQESGRAGRDGKESEAIIMCKRERGTEEREDRVEMLVGGRYCRRRALDLTMDGREDRVECEEGEVKCDICGEDESVGQEDEEDEEDEEVEEFVEEVERREWIRNVGVEKQSEVERIKWRLIEQLDKWGRQCALCLVEWKEDAGTHVFAECSKEEAHQAKQSCAELEKIRYEVYSCCFFCGTPQEICKRWEEGNDGCWKMVKGVDCQYSGVIIPAVVAILGASDEDKWGQRLKEWGSEDDVDVMNGEKVRQWFGRRIRFGNMEATQLVKIFYMLSTEWESERDVIG